MKKKRMSALVCALSFLGSLGAQHVKMLPYGNMNSWVTRHVKESGIIGGDTKTLYAIGPTQTINTSVPYRNLGGSPWASSNVMAKVMGITKTNTSVFPEPRNGGYCCRLETHLESVKVLGLINITVLASGSIYLGEMLEPIKSPKGPDAYLNNGIPFTDKPKALRFDYKYKSSGSASRIKETGFGKTSTVNGQDMGVAVLLLQKRWEDAKGHLFAHRIGTLVVHFESTSNWKNGIAYDIIYGDATKSPKYNASMRLNASLRYAKNSKGKNVPIKEVGWGTAEEQPTHLILQFASSHGGAFVGSPGNTLWIDNVGLVY